MHITLVSKNQYGDLLSNNSVRKALTYIIDTQGRMPYTDMSIKTYVYMGNTNKDDMLEKNLKPCTIRNVMYHLDMLR